MLRIHPIELSPRRTVAATLAVILLGAILVVGAPTLSAHGDDQTSGLSGSPSDGTAADGRSRFSYQIDPGQHINDFYEIRNSGTTPQTMKLLATDAFDSPSGDFSLLDTKAQPKVSGTWVTFTNGAHSIDIPLAPGASKVVSFRLSVPADAAPGDHAGGIVVSVTSAQGNIVVDRRVATRLYVRVKGALQASLTVSSIAAQYAPAINPFSGSTDVTFSLHNNGNVALGANLAVSVKTYFAMDATDVLRTSVAELLPGSTRVVTVSVPGVAQIGYLNPHVVLVPTVDKDALSPGVLRSTERETSIFVTPWWLIIVMLLAAASWLFIVWRRRRDARNAQAWVDHIAAEARRTADGEGAGLVSASASPDSN